MGAGIGDPSKQKVDFMPRQQALVSQQFASLRAIE